MLDRLGCHSAVKEYWNAVAPHVQDLFCHRSLGTKIKMNRIGEFEFLSERPTHTRPMGTLKVVMEGASGGRGWGYQNVVCDSDYKGKSTSWIKWYEDPIKFAGVSSSTQTLIHKCIRQQ